MFYVFSKDEIFIISLLVEFMFYRWGNRYLVSLSNLFKVYS